MTAAIVKCSNVVNTRSKAAVAAKISANRGMSVTITVPVVPLNPPVPIPAAKGSLGNVELRELAKNRQPPLSWYKGEEEQLF